MGEKQKAEKKKKKKKNRRKQWPALPPSATRRDQKKNLYNFLFGHRWVSAACPRISFLGTLEVCQCGLKFHSENQLPGYIGSGLKVSLRGGWVVPLRHGQLE